MTATPASFLPSTAPRTVLDRLRAVRLGLATLEDDFWRAIAVEGARPRLRATHHAIEDAARDLDEAIAQIEQEAR